MATNGVHLSQWGFVLAINVPLLFGLGLGWLMGWFDEHEAAKYRVWKTEDDAWDKAHGFGTAVTSEKGNEE